MAGPVPPRPTWYGRARAGASGVITAFTSGEFAEATMVDTGSLPPGSLDEAVELWRAEYDPDSGWLTWVDTMTGHPAMWFVLVAEPACSPPARSLVAFDLDPNHGPSVSPGSVLTDEAFAGLDLDPSCQRGALRWIPSTGRIEQIYVQPAFRRRRIGTALLHAASAAHLAAGGTVALWGGGDRTDLGEVFAERLGWSHRLEARRSRVAPMTPPDAAAGLDRHYLEPDA